MAASFYCLVEESNCTWLHEATEITDAFGLRGQYCGGKTAEGTMDVVRISRKRILLAGGKRWYLRSQKCTAILGQKKFLKASSLIYFAASFSRQPTSHQKQTWMQYSTALNSCTASI